MPMQIKLKAGDGISDL